jgi:hypothetical protein
MKLNLFFLIGLLFFTVSCKEYLFKKSDNNSLTKTEEDIINYSSLDAYPLLPECANITNRILQKDCFYKQLTSRIQASLDKNLMEINQNIQDTIWVKININSFGKTRVKTIIVSDAVKEYLPKLDGMLHVSIEKLPILKPAIKLGIPVTSEFSLPILLQNN